MLLLPLIIFKYTDFFYRDVIGPFFGVHDNLLNVTLPLGISFMSFTLTAYLVDIYREAFSSKHRPRTILAYVLFFPHLIAGPILRPYELDPAARSTARRDTAWICSTAGDLHGRAHQEAGIRR